MNDIMESIVVVIPLYNHASTIVRVVSSVVGYGVRVLVVDDGSTDCDEQTVADIKSVGAAYIRHEKNMGKGAAIMTAVNELKKYAPAVTHMITFDADGQHFGDDLPKFFEKIKGNPRSVIVGFRDFRTANVGAGSRYGRAFSNFWFRIQTSHKLSDVQSGYRAYPLVLFDFIKCRETRFSFEVEVLVLADWAGFRCVDLPVSVYYPPKHERISHFDMIKDNVRLSILNTRLTMRSMIPVPHRKVRQDKEGNITLIHPFKSIKLLLADRNTPMNLAISAALGMFLGTFPIIALHSLAILMVASYFGLNKYLGLAVSQLCMPPFVPALAVEAGYYLRNGSFLTEISIQTIGYQFFDRLFEYIIGAIVLSPMLGAIVGMITYVVALAISKSLRENGDVV